MLENQLVLAVNHEINTFQLEMLLKNRIPGILPITLKEENFCVDTKGYMPLKSYLESHTLTIKTFKMMLEYFLGIMEDSLLYYLNWSNYSLSCEHIFISADIQSIALVYMPVEGQDESNPIKSFVTQTLLLNGKFNTEEDWNFMILGLNTLNTMSMSPNQIEILYDVFQLRTAMLVEKQMTREMTEEASPKRVIRKRSRLSELSFFKNIIKEKADPYLKKEERVNSGKTVLLKKNPIGLMLVSEDTQHSAIRINKSNVILGRHKKSVDALLKDPSIGKYHAEIVCDEEKYYVRDLNSLNGTYLNGKKVSSYETKEINIGDRISFASINYKVESCD